MENRGKRRKASERVARFEAVAWRFGVVRTAQIRASTHTSEQTSGLASERERKREREASFFVSPPFDIHTHKRTKKNSRIVSRSSFLVSLFYVSTARSGSSSFDGSLFVYYFIVIGSLRLSIPRFSLARASRRDDADGEAEYQEGAQRNARNPKPPLRRHACYTRSRKATKKKTEKNGGGGIPFPLAMRPNASP